MIWRKRNRLHLSWWKKLPRLSILVTRYRNRALLSCHLNFSNWSALLLLFSLSRRRKKRLRFRNVRSQMRVKRILIRNRASARKLRMSLVIVVLIPRRSLILRFAALILMILVRLLIMMRCTTVRIMHIVLDAWFVLIMMDALLSPPAKLSRFALSKLKYLQEKTPINLLHSKNRVKAWHTSFVSLEKKEANRRRTLFVTKRVDGKRKGEIT